jgi:hypothetical protein
VDEVFGNMDTVVIGQLAQMHNAFF